MKFGTFGGVFTPCTLTIIGVIMFLRFGEVVGQSGLINAILVVLLAKAITTLTGLSLSAIATNTRVKGGGAYYLISRSLGLEFGGAIGIVFYLAQAVAVAMYIIGFTEAFADSLPIIQPFFTEVATFVNLVIFACVYKGAPWAIKVQYFILGILAISILSFFAGASLEFNFNTLLGNLEPNYTPNHSFGTMFALFFPAATGIMAGANMSGDLKNPARSIPLGTITAIAVTGVVYISVAILLAAVRTSSELLANPLIMKEIALLPGLITAGIFAATLSSAIGSMMGAPRILQAFAKDNIITPLKYFARGKGVANEPQRAIVLTFVLSQICILLGDLNSIAPIISMFFILTYGLVNLATFYEAITKNPSYRPTFRYCHWSLSLLGALSCGIVMFLIDPIWAIIAILTISLLHNYISNKEIEARWGNLNSGIAFERARKSLLRLEAEAYHPKNWRPSILAFAIGSWNRPHLLVFAHWLTAGHGVLSLAQVVRGCIHDHAERKDAYEATLRKFLAKQEIQAFPAVVIAHTASEGLESLIQCHGIGGLKPNTILFGWPHDIEKATEFCNLARLARRLRRSVIAARFADHREVMVSPVNTDEIIQKFAFDAPSGTIDVWWRGLGNGALMLLLAHLLQQNPGWRQNRIRLLRGPPNQEASSEFCSHIENLTSRSRIPAEAVSVVTQDIKSGILSASQKAALVILGFEPPQEGNELVFYEKSEDLAGSLARVIFVNSAGGMEID